MPRSSQVAGAASVVVMALVVLLLAAGTTIAGAGPRMPREVAPPEAPGPLTGLFLDGEPGATPHAATAYYAPGSYTFSADTSSAFALELVVSPGPLALTFGTATEGAELAEGVTYQVAPWPSPRTGIIFMGNSGQGCTSGTGEFTMLDWNLAPNGTVISAAVDFRHDCDYGTEAWLYGSVRFNSAVPITALDTSDGPVELGTFRTGTRSAGATVTLSNPGSVPVAIGAIDVSGTNMDGIEVDATGCPPELDAGASCELAVASDGLQRGPIDARILISDGTQRGQRWVAVTGHVRDATAAGVTLLRRNGVFDATVTVTPSAATGRVDFEIRAAGEATRWEIGYITSGGATTTSVAPPLGPFDVIAHYRGAADFEPSNSGAAAGVATVPTVIDLWAPQTQAVGNPITVVAGVRAYIYPLPAGTLEVRDGAGAVIATLAVTGSTHEITVERPADMVGRHSWTATYTSTAGDADPASATTWTDVVPPLLTTLGITPSPITGSPTVTLQLAAPSVPDGVVRISNDGEHWVERPWTPTVTWSLIGPDGGGIDEDGLKTVTVFYGADSAWTMYGTAATQLDRLAPTVQDPVVAVDMRTWSGTPTPRDWDWASMRYSLDGTTWTPWRTDGILDLWATGGAAAWYAGNRAIWVEAKDVSGNASAPVQGTVTFLDDDLIAPAGGEGSIAVGFQFPEAAITGHAFTIHPTYPIGYSLPPNAWCEWSLAWGDDASLLQGPNGTWGEVRFERAATTGACADWTFTLPYTADRQLTWRFDLYLKAPGAGPEDNGPAIYTGPVGRVFKALRESSDRRFLTSSVPIAYVLPTASGAARIGVPVTYQLHLAGAGVLPAEGDWSAAPIGCSGSPSLVKHGGTSWTYTPRCDGAWTVRWTATMDGGLARSQAEPVVDGRAPEVSTPTASIRATTPGSGVPISLSWTGADTGSGVSRYEAQVSRNGGAWRAVTLPDPRVASLTRTLSPSGTYRFRVRARDWAGNWSSWVLGSTLRPRALQETSTAGRWSSGWARVTASALDGGAARATVRPGAWVKFTVRGRAVAWSGRRGPGMGRAQVLVDGVPVATIDLGATAWTRPQVLFTKRWGSIGTHQVVVRNLGTAGRPRIELDSVLVLQ